MREQIIQALAAALLSNQGNRITPELITGIVSSVARYAADMEAQASAGVDAKPD